jgi:hypothetical protein
MRNSIFGQSQPWSLFSVGWENFDLQRLTFWKACGSAIGAAIDVCRADG